MGEGHSESGLHSPVTCYNHAWNTHINTDKVHSLSNTHWQYNGAKLTMNLSLRSLAHKFTPHSDVSPLVTASNLCTRNHRHLSHSHLCPSMHPAPTTLYESQHCPLPSPPPHLQDTLMFSAEVKVVVCLKCLIGELSETHALSTAQPLFHTTQWMHMNKY